MRSSLERIAQMVRKELLQTFRDSRLRRLVFMAPLVQLVIFGYAVSTDVRHTKTFVVDHDRSRASRDLLDAFTSSGYFRIIGRSDRSGDLVEALDRGRAVVGIEIPPDFARKVGAGEPAEIRLLVDGTNSNVGTIALGYAERIVQSYGARTTTAAVSAPVDFRPRAWFNPSLDSKNYNVPAVVGIIIMLICLLLTSLAVVREGEIGTLEQLRVSPLTPAELILAKTIPFALIGLLDFAIVTTAAILWFRVPFHGNLLLLLLASICYLLPALGLGLFISTISRTQQEAFMSTFLVMMPTILLSGFMFPVSGMPVLFRWLTLLNPVRHYLEIVRAVYLKGAGLDALWPQFLALVAMGAGVILIASRRFHKTVG